MIDPNQRNSSINKIELFADQLVVDIKNDPFSYRTDMLHINDLNTNEEFKMLEYLLVEKMPNLVITHHDTDTPEDLSNQLKKVKDILERGMLPYFMDFSIPKQNVKKR